jgi:hypothetical protein
VTTALVGACADTRHPSPSTPSDRAAQRQDPDASPRPDVAVPGSTPAAGERCGDVVGEWSGVVDGLRGRLITSGSRADRTALRVTVELENVSGQGPLEINWSGRPNLGFVTFRLEDATGADVPEPPWRLGGNEAVGDIRELIPPTGTVRHDVAENVFERFGAERILRIGAFWARPMPADGSRRFLRAIATGHVPTGSEALLDRAEGGVVRPASPSDPRGRVWLGSLTIPAVCID